MKILRYILPLLIIGLYASPFISTKEDTSSQTEYAPSATVILNDLSNDYAKRIQLVATAKQPTLRLKLASGVDSLRQTKVFLEKYRNCCNPG